MANKWVYVTNDEFGTIHVFTTKKKAIEYCKDRGYPYLDSNTWTSDAYPEKEKDGDDYISIQKCRLE